MSEKILITGGGGFIGCVLVPELLQRGYRVTVIDHFAHADEALKAIPHPKLNVVVGDVRDEKLMATQLSACDVVIPLAALVGAPACAKSPQLANEVNLLSIRMMMTKLSSAQRVIFPSTCSVYGDALEETVTETSAAKPLSIYAQTKWEAENNVMQHSHATSLRLSTAFGVSPRMRDDLICNDWVARAISRKFLVLFEPNHRRSFVHVRDIASAFLLAVEKPKRTEGQIFNVVHAEGNVTKWELATQIQGALSSVFLSTSDAGRDLDGRNYFVSGNKLFALGYVAKYSLPVGIAELIQHYRVRGLALGSGKGNTQKP